MELNLLEKIFSGYYDIKISSDSTFFKLLELIDVDINFGYNQSSSNTLNQIMNDFPDYDLNEYYPEIKIDLIHKFNDKFNIENILLNDKLLNDFLPVKNALVDTLNTFTGKRSFNYFGIDCFSGKYRGIITFEQLKEIMKKSTEQDISISELVENILLNEYEWQQDTDRTNYKVYYRLK